MCNVGCKVKGKGKVLYNQSAYIIYHKGEVNSEWNNIDSFKQKLRGFNKMTIQGITVSMVTTSAIERELNVSELLAE